MRTIKYILFIFISIYTFSLYNVYAVQSTYPVNFDDASINSILPNSNGVCIGCGYYITEYPALYTPGYIGDKYCSDFGDVFISYSMVYEVGGYKAVYADASGAWWYDYYDPSIPYIGSIVCDDTPPTIPLYSNYGLYKPIFTEDFLLNYSILKVTLVFFFCLLNFLSKIIGKNIRFL